MPVTKSAKKALKTAIRRRQENLLQKAAYKGAIKAVKKAETGTVELMSKAQSALDKAAKKNTIHPNKAARLKSRLAKLVATKAAPEAPKKETKKAAPKKTATAKA